MGPLTGVKIVEFAGVGPGPMAGMLLADLGASVVRIDRLSPANLGVVFDPRFDITARGRRSIALDITKPQSAEIVLRLLDDADVLIEGFRPGVMERLGYGPDIVLQRNPRLVYGRITGFGQTGPLATAAGHDLNYISLSGALDAIGEQGGKPIPPLNLIGDYGGGALYLAMGVLAALIERQTSGRGQVVDAAIVDGAISLMSVFYGLRAAGEWNSERGANYLDGGAPFYDTYETADGRYMAIAPIEPKFFKQLAEKIGLDPSLIAAQAERARWPELREALQSIFRSRSQNEWTALLEGTDCCVTPVLTLDEARHHPHVQARGLFAEKSGVWQPTQTPRFSRSDPGELSPICPPGNETAAILTEISFTENERSAFQEAGVISLQKAD